MRKHTKKKSTLHTSTIKWERGTGAQSRCFERADRFGYDFFIARQKIIGDRFTYEYTSFSSINDFLNFSNKYKGKHHFNEIIRQNKPCVEYYDIDGSWNDFSSIQECLCLFIKLRCDFGQEQGETDRVLYDDLIVTEACNSSKLSLHIIIRKGNKYFENTDDQRRWQNNFSDWLGDMFKHDLSVYNKNSIMRCINSSKVSDPDRILKPWGHSKRIKNKRLFFCSYIPIYYYGRSEYNTPPIPNGLPINVVRKETKVVTVKRDPIEFPELVENLTHIIDTISPTRASEYDTWFAISASIKSVLGDCQDAFDLYHYFSEQCIEKYNQDDCTRQWDNIKAEQYNKFSIATLYRFYHLDKPKIRRGKSRLLTR